MALGSVVIIPRAASAQSCDYDFYSSQDISFYDPCSTCSTGGGGVLAGDTNEAKIFSWLMSKGFNAAQAAGMMGNMNTESSFNPFRMQTTYSDINAVLPVEGHTEYMKAWGLVQWDGGRRQQIISQAIPRFADFVTDVNAYGQSADGYKQAGAKNDEYLSFALDFMFQELQGGYTHVYEGIKSQPDSEEGVRAAAELWNRQYEVSGDYSSDRADKGVELYNQLKGTAAVAGTSGSSSSTSSSCGGEGKPAGTVVWYSQCDDQWATSGYAGDTICSVGCGPTSMAIILASIVDKNIKPTDVAAVAGDQSSGTSSHANLINGVNQKWGLSISTKSLTMDEAIQFVRSGQGYVWMGGQGEPPFTRGGHLVAMVGASADGQTVTIADPFGDGPGHQHIADYPTSQIEAAGQSRYGVPKK